MRPVLCLVTNRTRCGGEAGVLACVHHAAAAGIHLLQVREKDLDDGVLHRLTVQCVEAVRGTRTRILVNDRFDIALAAGAHGVHLSSTGVPSARIRRVVGSGFLIGRSVHGVEEARRVVADGGIDYLLFGSVFPSQSKPGCAPAGVEALRNAAASVVVPVLAIGGVTIERMPVVARSGAAGAAAIGLFADAAAAGAERLHRVVEEAALAFDTSLGVP